MRSSATSVLVAAITLAALACGGGGGEARTPTSPTTPTTPTTPTAPSTAATVVMRGDSDGYGGSTFSFVPAALTVARGATVTFSNRSGVSHNVTFADEAGAPANVGNHSTGDNARTFATAGTFPFQCTSHAGMTGVVTVTP